ncbi:MAG TPA: branched-chain amino acid ABC transporter permease [Rhodoblastus sp.]|nr:branched-chain amino acid ABC transporter permease [Rhodoblastus sp.]
MNFDIAAILAVDGVASGAIYALVAIGTVLLFSVTRVMFVPFGDLAAFTALTLAALDDGKTPGTVNLVVALAVLAFAMEAYSLVRAGRAAALPRAALFYLAVPIAIALAVRFLAPLTPPLPLRLLMALALIVPVAPLLDRIVFRPVADAPVLLLLIIAVALHFALVGVGLLFFGPEGVRTQPLTSWSTEIFGAVVSGQTICIVVAAVALSALLYVCFEYTLIGKALRATSSNRTGARLMGIRPARAGTIAYVLGSVLAGVSGLLIAPVNTIFYDSGFLIGLKAFVGAIIGGLYSYPGAAIGAVIVGLLESFASFVSSSLKDVIVFSILVPILIWRSLISVHVEEEDEE